MCTCVTMVIPTSGSRMQKYWFLVSPNTTVQSGTQLLLTMVRMMINDDVMMM